MNTAAGDDLVMWRCNGRQQVLLMREQVDWLFDLAEKHDRIPIAWQTSGGYVFVLMPTYNPYDAARKGGLSRA